MIDPKTLTESYLRQNDSAWDEIPSDGEFVAPKPKPKKEGK